jgi:hypothetical protein
VRTAPLAAALVLLAAPAAVRADEVVLVSGRVLEGKAVVTGETVLFERPGIRMELRKDEVKEIRRTPTAKEQYAEKAAALLAAEMAGTLDAGARHRLGLWCATKGLAEEAVAEQRNAILIDADHPGARKALGFVKTETGWRNEAEAMEAKGLVRADGRWVTKEEAVRLERDGTLSLRERERREAKEREKAHRRTLNAALRRVADADPKVRLAGEKDLVEVARSMGEADLEARAPEIRAYYDRFHEEIVAARALLQVRAQLVTLKRPIPTLTTSLGGFSSPVTLQLPELSIISVNTTVMVPLEVEE